MSFSRSVCCSTTSRLNNMDCRSISCRRSWCPEDEPPQTRSCSRMDFFFCSTVVTVIFLDGLSWDFEQSLTFHIEFPKFSLILMKNISTNTGTFHLDIIIAWLLHICSSECISDNYWTDTLWYCTFHKLETFVLASNSKDKKNHFG